MASRILIVAPAWVGDMVMAQSLVARLGEVHPGAQIDLVAPPWTAPLGARMPGVRQAFALDAEHGRLGLGPRGALGRRLRSQGYDLAIVLPRSWKSALTPWVARARVRRGYRGEMRFGLLNDVRRLDKARLPRTIDRFVALAGGEGPPADPVLSADTGRGGDLAERLGLSGDGPMLALCPGAEYGPAKQWPAAHFAALAALAASAGWRPVVFGSAKEAALGDEIVRSRGANASSLAGRTGLLDAVDLLALADAVVTNDSGLMHVAAALGRPTVALFGSTSTAITPPLGPKVAVEELELPCRPCLKRECPLGTLACLTGIEPAAVWRRVLALA